MLTHLNISGLAMRAAYIVVMTMDAATQFSCLSSAPRQDEAVLVFLGFAAPASILSQVALEQDVSSNRVAPE